MKINKHSLGERECIQVMARLF
jgi:hypothetical protein